MRGNTPPSWAIKAIGDNAEQIQALVPPSMLPIDLTEEIACGGVGCAWHTLNKQIVFKVTSEREEYEFAIAAMQMPRAPRGVVKFYEAVELDTQGSDEDGTWNVFAIWREWVEDTGDRLLSARAGHEFESVTNAYNMAVTDFTYTECPWPTVDDIRQAARRLSRSLVKEDALSSHVAQYDGPELYVVMDWIEEMIINSELRAVGQALRYFRQRRMLLYDVNETNVGTVRRGAKEIYAIFDAHMVDFR